MAPFHRPLEPSNQPPRDEILRALLDYFAGGEAMVQQLAVVQSALDVLELEVGPEEARDHLVCAMRGSLGGAGQRRACGDAGVPGIWRDEDVLENAAFGDDRGEVGVVEEPTAEAKKRSAKPPIDVS